MDLVISSALVADPQDSVELFLLVVMRQNSFGSILKSWSFDNDAAGQLTAYMTFGPPDAPKAVPVTLAQAKTSSDPLIALSKVNPEPKPPITK